jgi:hypothetical protein
MHALSPKHDYIGATSGEYGFTVAHRAVFWILGGVIYLRRP